MTEKRLDQIKEAVGKVYILDVENSVSDGGHLKRGRRMHGMDYAIKGYRAAFIKGALWADANPETKENNKGDNDDDTQ